MPQHVRFVPEADILTNPIPISAAQFKPVKSASFGHVIRPRIGVGRTRTLAT
jgi:hypothetical protein